MYSAMWLCRHSKMAGDAKVLTSAPVKGQLGEVPRTSPAEAQVCAPVDNLPSDMSYSEHGECLPSLISLETPAQLWKKKRARVPTAYIAWCLTSRR